MNVITAKYIFPIFYMPSNNVGHLITSIITTLQHFATLHPTTLHYTYRHFTTFIDTSLHLSTLHYIYRHFTTFIDTSLPVIYASLPSHLA